MLITMNSKELIDVREPIDPRSDQPRDTHSTNRAQIRVLINRKSEEPIDLHIDPHSESTVWISMQINRSPSGAY